MVIENILFSQGNMKIFDNIASSSLQGIVFYKIILDFYTVIIYKIIMRDANYFTNPVHEWQRRYEALRASFVDRLPAKVVADRFGYTLSYVHLLRHLFIYEKVDFSEPVPEGKAARRRVTN